MGARGQVQLVPNRAAGRLSLPSFLFPSKPLPTLPALSLPLPSFLLEPLSPLPPMPFPSLTPLPPFPPFPPSPSLPPFPPFPPLTPCPLPPPTPSHPFRPICPSCPFHPSLRTNFDCDNLERFLNSLGGGGRGPGPNPYSCVVLAGGRSMEERRRALQVSRGYSDEHDKF